MMHRDESDDMLAAEYAMVEVGKQTVKEIEDRILQIRAGLPIEVLFGLDGPDEMARGRKNGIDYGDKLDELDGLYQALATQQQLLNNRIFELGYI